MKEYNVTSSKNKQERSPWWEEWFLDGKWPGARTSMERLLKRHVFTACGFPLDLLKGRVSCRDGVLLFKARKPSGDHMAEYIFRHGGKVPEWLQCDSAGKPRSSMTFFHAWLNDDGRDAVYMTDSPITAMRVMEAWWLAEGRFPDITWTSCSYPQRMCKGDGVLDDRHVLCIGSDSLVKALAMRGVRVDARMKSPRGMLPDEIYISCRKLEDVANDSGNYGHTCELQMDVGRQHSGRHGLASLPKSGTAGWSKLREVQTKCLPAGGIPQAIRHSPGFHPVREGEGARRGEGRVPA